MALRRSTDLPKTSIDNPKHDESGIEMSHITGNIYDSLENRDRDSHAYSTTGEAEGTTKSGTHNVDSKAQPNDREKRVAFSSRKLTMWKIAVTLVFICTLLCTISGFIVYHVVNARIAEIEHHTSQNHEMTPKTNVSEALAIDIKLIKAELTQFNNDWQEQIDLISKNHSKTRANHDDLNRHVSALDNVVHSVQETLQTVEQKQNISGQHVAFTADGATGKLVNGVLTFRNVILNAGDAYNQTTGLFRCPVAGTYLFSATLVSVGVRSDRTYCYIRKNAIITALVYSYEGTHDTVSVSVLIHLSVRDLVDLGSCYNVKAIDTTSWRTRFIGFLIQAE